MSPKSQDVKQSDLFGFLAQPDAPTKSGVVILPTIFGVTKIRSSVLSSCLTVFLNMLPRNGMSRSSAPRASASSKRSRSGTVSTVFGWARSP